MGYCLSKIIDMDFENAVERTRSVLKEEGFGIITEIDLKEKMKEKLGVDIEKYMILGACNPPYAYEALKAEGNIGVLLPCNVIVKYLEDGRSEVGAIDAVSTMRMVENPEVHGIAEKIQEKLKRVLAAL